MNLKKLSQIADSHIILTDKLRSILTDFVHNSYNESKLVTPEEAGQELNLSVAQEATEFMEELIYNESTDEERCYKEWKGWGLYASAEIQDGNMVISINENI